MLEDVVEGYATPDHAKAVYGVVLTGSAADGTLAVDEIATERRRSALAASGAVPPPNVRQFG